MAQEKIFNCSSFDKQRAIFISMWLAIFIALFLVRSIILPFLLASLLAYVFHPIVVFLGRIKLNNRPLPRALSVIIIYLFLLSAIFLFMAFFIPQFYLEIVRLAKELSAFINTIDDEAINRLGQRIEAFFRTYQLPLEIVAPDHEQAKILHPAGRQNWISIDLLKVYHSLSNDILNYLKSEIKNIITSAQHLVTQVISGIFMSLLVLMITGFILVDVDRIKRFAFSLVPLKDRASFATFLSRLNQRLSGVVRGQITICVVNAFLTLLGLLIFKVKFAFTLAAMAGIFSIIPIFGSILSTIPIVLAALTQSPLTAFFSLLWIIGIHILEANYLNPKIMGDSAKIHPVLIILALLTGERFYGITGALLSVPIISVFITIFASLLGKAWKMDEGVANPVENDTISKKEV